MPTTTVPIMVISLDRTPQRFEMFVRSNPGIPVKRFSAVDGALLARADLVRDGLITESNQYRPGPIGTALSHIALWRQCAGAGAPLHIVEDDVVLRPDFIRAAGVALAALADWDVVLWSHNYDWPVMVRLGQGIPPVVMQYDHRESELGFDAFRADVSAPALVELVSAAGLPCYSISPRGAARMLSDCLPIGAEHAAYVAKPGEFWTNTGIDVEMSRHFKRWRSFFSLPSLALASNDQAASTNRGHLAAMHDPTVANRAPRGSDPGPLR